MYFDMKSYAYWNYIFRSVQWLNCFIFYAYWKVILARGLGVKVKGRVEKQDCNEQWCVQKGDASRGLIWEKKVENPARGASFQKSKSKSKNARIPLWKTRFLTRCLTPPPALSAAEIKRTYSKVGTATDVWVLEVPWDTRAMGVGLSSTLNSEIDCSTV